MADLSTIDSKVKTYVKNVPSIMVTEALSDASREFFQNARVWTETVTMNVDADEGSIAPALADDAKHEIVGVNWLKVDGKLIVPASFEIEPDTSTTGAPRFYGSIDGELILLYPTADKQYSIDVSLFVRPILSGTDVKAQMLSRYAKQLAHGAAGDLLSQTGYPWFDPAKAAYHMAKFNEGMQNANAVFAAGYTRSSNTVRQRPIG